MGFCRGSSVRSWIGWHGLACREPVLRIISALATRTEQELFYRRAGHHKR